MAVARLCALTKREIFKCKVPMYDTGTASMGLLVGPIELLLLQNEVFTDHDGTAARKVSEKRTNPISSLSLYLG